jgi:hypothetical protein
VGFVVREVALGRRLSPRQLSSGIGTVSLFEPEVPRDSVSAHSYKQISTDVSVYSSVSTFSVTLSLLSSTHFYPEDGSLLRNFENYPINYLASYIFSHCPET